MKRLQLLDQVPLYSQLLANRVGYLILDRVAPATIFALILSAKTNGLLAWLSVQQVNRDPIYFFSMFVYQLLVLAFLATICLLFIVRRPIKMRSAKLSSLVLALGGTFATTPLAFAAVSSGQASLILASVILMLAGMIMSIVALTTLGRCFGISPQARGLVTTGPYRLIRHPLYVGEEIAALGVLLPVITPFTIGIFILHCILQYLRARSEEQLLSVAFPDYVSYAHKVARFIPHVY